MQIKMLVGVRNVNLKFKEWSGQETAMGWPRTPRNIHRSSSKALTFRGLAEVEDPAKEVRSSSQ